MVLLAMFTVGLALAAGTWVVAPVSRAMLLPVGMRRVPRAAKACTVCECEGISDSRSDTVSEPPVSPRSWSDRPGPCPGCIGALPCMLGRAKFDLPSPPYVVPRREKSAVFCESGKIWPSQNAHPFGAKLNGKMRISATNGSMFFSPPLSLRREDAEQRDDEVDAEVGLEVVVRLTSAGIAGRSGRHGRIRSGRVIELDGLGLGQHVARRSGSGAEARRGQERMAVRGDL